MHPYIESLDKKEFLTLDESAVLNAFKRPLVKEHTIKRWLRELNPEHKTGPALNEWVQEVVDSLGRSWE
jgi:hypothetical protein